jgi:hypothetical protein
MQNKCHRYKSPALWQQKGALTMEAKWHEVRFSEI